MLSTITDAQGTGTITDDDPTPTLSIDDVSRVEGGPVHAFTVTLSAASGQQVTVDYPTAEAPRSSPRTSPRPRARSPSPPGETTKTVNVTAINDAARRGDETFNVGLSNAVGDDRRRHRSRHDRRRRLRRCGWRSLTT